jgi:tRNA (guanosine-2'-O-)-methyltransferase
MKEKLVKYLEKFVTQHRKDLINEILEYRTRYITVVLEDIYQSQNASAVLRTCECFGIQDVHIIENKNRYEINPDVTLGANKWLNLIKYRGKENIIKTAVASLKSKGYRIVATTPDINKTQLKDFDLNKGRAAILLGTELTGLSDEILNLSDEYLNIPLYGFTRSYNISVSAAIILYQLISELRISKLPWHLTEQEKQDIRIKWLKESIRKSDLIENSFIYRLNS